MRTETETFIINPYIAGSPVKNPTMFFGRDDVYAWLRQHLRGRYQDNVIVLYGERRSGKTSVLYQMNEELRDDTYVPVLIDLQSMHLEGVDGFLWELARKIVLALRGVEGMGLIDRPARSDFEENARHQFEEVFLPPILAALGERHLLLMFDETNRLEEKIAAGDLSPETINYLRSLIQHSQRLNFIFSLGTRVEEAARLSFELFNLAVYRKISFLEQDFAEDLITSPVAQHYTYTEAAIERIFELTSGQPYYTQLLCHNLFSYWTKERPVQLDVGDVNAILPDIIEQATPNLQFAWDDSTPVEKAILAALAATLPQYQAGIMRRTLDRALRDAGLFPPAGDITNGLKRLFERDILNNQEPYKFRVGFLRLWLTEYKRLDWVHEELGEAVADWHARETKRLEEAPTALEQARRWAAPVLAGVVIGGLLALVLFWTTFVPPPPPSESRADDLSTQVANLQQTAIAAQAEVGRAISEGNAEEIGLIKATGTAAAAEVAVAQAQATEVSEQEATKIAGEIDAVNTQAAIAQGTAQVLEATLDHILEAVTDTPTATLIPSDTPPPSSTPTASPPPTATPLPPTATPTPRPEGRLAIPVVSSGGQYNVNIYDVTTGELLNQVLNASQPNFNETGDKLAVKAQRGDGDTIWVYDGFGRNGSRASPALRDSRPAWGPDGQSLVYENRDTPKDGQTVWRISVQDDLIQPTSQDVSLLDGEIFDADRPLYPLWSESGDIIFSACNYWTGTGNRCGIWRTKSTATTNNEGFLLPQNLTQQREIPTDTAGDRLLLMGETDHTWDVYLGSIEAGGMQNLSNNSANDGLGVFSPDGYWVAFVSDRNGAWTVWVLPSRGGTALQLPITDLRFGSGDRGWTTERIAWAP